MKTNKPLLALLALSITSSTVAYAQLRPGGPGNQQPGLTPGAPGNQTPPPVVAPSKKQLDARRLEELVKRSGEAYAREVLEVLGSAYRVRYNVREGILSAKGRWGDFDNINNVMASGSYQQASSSGKTMGQIEGQKAGVSAAYSTSRAMADSDISAAVDVAIDTGAAIVFKANPRTAQFNGVEANLMVPSNVEQRFINNRSARQAELNRLVGNTLSSELSRSIFDINAIYNRHETSLPEYMRGDSAVRNMLDDTLRSNSGLLSEARSFYREIGSSEYENPSANQEAFRRGFLQFYSRGVENMWQNTVMTRASLAFDTGEEMYRQEADAYASELGNFDGYRSSYRASSINGFNNEIINAYNRNFAEIKNSVQNSSYLTAIDAAVVAEVNGKTEFSIGDTFDVVINQAKNRGMQTGNMKVDIASQGAVLSMNLGTNLQVAGLSKLQPQRVVRVGWLSDITAADQDVTVTALVGDRTVSANFKVTYEETIRKIANPATDAVTADILMGKACDYMKKQYDDISGFSDQYRNRRGDMLLVRVRALFDKLSEAEKTQLRSKGQAIRNVFGGKPSRFLNAKRDEWDAANAMMSEMALGGSEPK